MTVNLRLCRVDDRGAGGARWVGVLLILLLVGCATGPNANPRDPLEPFNRGVFKFNDAVDAAVLKPVATAYRDVTPEMVQVWEDDCDKKQRTSLVLNTISNFFF